MRNVRIFFEKKDTAKYISHLDLMRCFSRAVKRAEIAVWYTEGFNPHPFMTFSLPLSLGTESFCESVDMRITDEMTDSEIKERLNAALPSGIAITKVKEPVHKAEEIAFAQFNISFHTKKNEKVKNALETALSADEILAEKKAKQGRKKVMKQVNIKENIKSFKLDALNDTVELNIVLTAGSNNNINPSLLISAVTKEISEDIESVDIVKQKMLCADMTEFE